MSRFHAPILGSYNQALLIVQMFPLILAIIPLFIFFRRLNMVNNFVPVVLVYTVTQLPFATWMLRSYFDSIPRELDEAAKVDGCSPLRIFAQIILPLTAPGIAAVAIFSFLFSYNEFFISSVFLRDENRMTMPVGPIFHATVLNGLGKSDGFGNAGNDPYTRPVPVHPEIPDIGSYRRCG